MTREEANNYLFALKSGNLRGDYQYAFGNDKRIISEI